ncbi:MAG: Lrp/AsnC ligand binding domain-containing protein [Silicimonas sp.]|nr:Lrp/AsnC ligand binding domain-containing protein [Silicimonas sp.]MBT8424567.1 Lrp/AsnC ligand binding domain-containing protein [Silicimonas sp.]NND42364.1 winged helix-turn-helix transcriptional regulator [Silicimonas sp.]NNF91348.1 winged helix-turn-helix transcriptional regulator [Boseongicola sp.]RZW07476.1 MAG: winged helix-turn-helix transcriptional regulator [Paracoccaceae bacterium]
MASDLSGLDRTDRRILAELSTDARLPVAELARRVGLSKTPVQSRLKRLEEAGVIRGYRALLDPVKLGLDHVAFVEVTLNDTRESALRAFNDAVGDVVEIEECHMIAGAFDYLLKVRTRDMNRYRQVLGERISSLPHVAQTSTHVVMQAVKDTGFVT